MTRMATTKTYDFVNRISAISNWLSASSPLTLNYAYNNANQRARVNLADGSFWLYEYDSLGQLKSGKKFWQDWTPVAGQQFRYAFDDIGNRTSTLAGGDQAGQSLRPASYNANSLNQYTSRDVPGYIDIMGLSYATNTVTVNGQTAYRKGEYFRSELSTNNSSGPVWQSVSVAATGQTTVTGNEFVAQTPEAFGYERSSIRSEARLHRTRTGRFVVFVAIA